VGCPGFQAQECLAVRRDKYRELFPRLIGDQQAMDVFSVAVDGSPSDEFDCDIVTLLILYVRVRRIHSFCVVCHSPDSQRVIDDSVFARPRNEEEKPPSRCAFFDLYTH
jgi:hypothetical protein